MIAIGLSLQLSLGLLSFGCSGSASDDSTSVEVTPGGPCGDVSCGDDQYCESVSGGYKPQIDYTCKDLPDGCHGCDCLDACDAIFCAEADDGVITCSMDMP